jgi:enterochelin esterase-like enzyme
LLNRRYPVYIYIPAEAASPLPAIYVTDGGEYLSLASAAATLDRLIGTGRMRPVAGVFVDPRTDPADRSSTRRMTDYAASSSFIDFLEQEVAPFVEARYPVSGKPEERAIVGASLGGLIATYAVLARPGFVSKCGAQSPAYFFADSAVIKLLDTMRTVRGDFYIQAGTLSDTQLEARLVTRALRERGAQVLYEEFPEGHNWTNWRTHLAAILEHFFPPH